MLCRTRDKSSEIQCAPRRTLKGSKLGHGDMIFLQNTTNSNAVSNSVNHEG